MTSRLSGRTLGHVDPFEGFLSDVRGLRTHFGRCEVDKIEKLYRTLGEILTIIPDNEENLKERLTDIRDSVSYAPPEMHPHWYTATVAVLDSCLTARLRAGEGGWAADVHEVWILQD